MKNIIRINAVIVLAVMSLLLATHVNLASAAIAYDNFGPGDSYATHGYGTGTYPSGNTYVIAGDFAPTVSGTLNEIWLALTGDPQNVPPEDFSLSIYADAAGTMGSLLWQDTFDPDLGGIGSLFHTAALSGPELTSGQTYWLKVENVGDVELFSWFHNNTDDMGSFAQKKNSDPWQYWSDTSRFAMRFGVVPEPFSMLLYGAGLLGLAGLRKKKKETV